MKNQTELATKTQTSVDNLEFVLSDTSGLAETALNRAIEFCAEKMTTGNQPAALELVRNNDRSAEGYFHYSLAEQAAEWLGAWDKDVKAVYIYNYEATPEDVCFDESAHPTLLHLIVWTRRKTGALQSILEALDRALARGRADLIGPRDLAHLLDAQIVDDHQVKNSIGSAALLTSLHTRPLKIWER